MKSYSDILAHRGMLVDHVRMQAYQQAIHAVVRPGAVVADLGTGSGVLAFFAVQAGARQVYAIEKGTIIQAAAQLAEHNGMADRIVFIKGSSDQVDLPEPVDVITSELIGLFGLEEDVAYYLTNFRDRFLKPGGALVPTWLDLYLTPVESPELWSTSEGLWSKDFYGLDFSSVRTEDFSDRHVADCRGKVRRLAPETAIAHYDFPTLTEIPHSFEGRTPLESGTLHGYVGYFKAALAPEVIISTSPDAPLTHWQQTFFPLPEPVPVQAGDILEYRITSFQIGTIFWKWDTRLINPTQRREFSQNNFGFSRQEVMAYRNDYVPTLSPEAEINRLVLESCNGRRTIAEIAEILQNAYPESYQDISKAIRKSKSILIDNILL